MVAKRTVVDWQRVVQRPEVPTALLNLLEGLIQRIDDLEEVVYKRSDSEESHISPIDHRMNTQGR